MCYEWKRVKRKQCNGFLYDLPETYKKKVLYFSDRTR